MTDDDIIFLRVLQVDEVNYRCRCVFNQYIILCHITKLLYLSSIKSEMIVVSFNNYYSMDFMFFEAAVEVSV